jgi:hypothetical protein
MAVRVEGLRREERGEERGKRREESGKRRAIGWGFSG